jgi:hypothetical protein
VAGQFLFSNPKENEDRSGDEEIGDLEARAGDEEIGDLEARAGEEEIGDLEARAGDEEIGDLEARAGDEENNKKNLVLESTDKDTRLEGIWLQIYTT